VSYSSIFSAKVVNKIRVTKYVYLFYTYEQEMHTFNLELNITLVI